MRLPAVVAALATLAAPGVALADVTVAIDQVRRLSFVGAASDVVVGNPEVADVTVVDGRNVFVTGRAAGVTDVIVLDASGRILFNDAVAVSPAGGRGPVVSIARGATVSSVSCSGRCQDGAGAATVTRGAPSVATAARAAAPTATAPGVASGSSAAPSTAGAPTEGSAG